MNNLRCDFHIHSNNSDGECSIEQILELYAQEKFDVIAITDHALDIETLEEVQATGWSPAVTRKDFPDYLHQLELAKKKAADDYNLHLIRGIEVSNNVKGYHIIALDVKEWISPDLSVPDIVAEIHRQDAIAIACHAGPKEGELFQPIYEHLNQYRKEYQHLFDAWEVANRHHLFAIVGLMDVNHLASSDFHVPDHIYSWKTLIQAEKFNTASVKKAIQENRTSFFLHRANA